MIKYCKLCVLPNTKPNVIFEENICSACKFHSRKKNNIKKGINWKKEKLSLIN